MGTRIRLFAAFAFAAVGLAAPPCAPGADIALMIPNTYILEGDDPANDDPPGAKEFTIETLMADHGGLYALVTRLEEAGHNVKMYGSDTDDPAVVKAENDLVYIPEAIGSTSIDTDYVDSPIPLIIAETFLLDNMGFTNGVDAGFSNNLHADTFVIANPDHPITQGLPAEFVITIDDPERGQPATAILNSFTDSAIIGILNDVGVGEVLVTASGYDSRVSAAITDSPMVIAAEKGALLDNGTPIRARWVFLPFADLEIIETPETPAYEERTYALLNDMAWQLILQAIDWALAEDSGVPDWTVR